MTVATPAPVGTLSPMGVGSGTSLVITKPSSGVANGRVLVAGVRSQGTVTTITPPSGWVRADGANGAGDRAQGWFIHVVTDAASEPASYTFQGWSAGRSVGFIQAFENVDTANPIAGATAYSLTNLAAYTVAMVPVLALAMWGDERTSPRSHVPTGPAGYSMLANIQNTLDASTTGSRTALYAAMMTVGSSGSTTIPAASLTWPDGVSANRATGFALRGINAVDPVTTQPFTSVAHFLETPGAASAWRCGGGPWPQHSEYAADHSAALGWQAMEFSCGFTSDWATVGPFGLGPQYLDTIAGVTGNVDPGTMTFAQLNANYQNRNNPVSPGVYQPFWLLESFLAKYSATRICIVDPKFGFDTVAKIDKLLDICDAHGGPDRILIKFDAPTNATNLTTRAHARGKGYTCINYWGTDTTTMAAQQGPWDVLGLAYNADPSAWAAAKTHGKLLWGAIAPDQAGYDTAVARGAQFVNVSGVTSVAPVGAEATPWLSLIERVGAASNPLQAIEWNGTTATQLRAIER